MRQAIIEALLAHAKGHIEKHKANVEVLLEKTAGIAEHPDTLETIEKELKIIAEYDDELEMLRKYYIMKKARFATWKNRVPPKWFSDGLIKHLGGTIANG